MRNMRTTLIFVWIGLLVFILGFEFDYSDLDWRVNGVAYVGILTCIAGIITMIAGKFEETSQKM